MGIVKKKKKDEKKGRKKALAGSAVKIMPTYSIMEPSLMLLYINY